MQELKKQVVGTQRSSKVIRSMREWQKSGRIPDDVSSFMNDLLGAEESTLLQEKLLNDRLSPTDMDTLSNILKAHALRKLRHSVRGMSQTSG